MMFFTRAKYTAPGGTAKGTKQPVKPLGDSRSNEYIDTIEDNLPETKPAVKPQ